MINSNSKMDLTVEAQDVMEEVPKDSEYNRKNSSTNMDNRNYEYLRTSQSRKVLDPLKRSLIRRSSMNSSTIDPKIQTPSNV